MLKAGKLSLIKYIVSYLFILILPIVIGVYAYLHALKIVEQDSVALNMVILEQGKNTVDGYLKNIKNTASQLVLNLSQNQITYVSGTVEGDEIIRILDTQKFLVSSILTNDFLKDYYIFFKNGNAIISSDKAYLDPELFYKHYLSGSVADYNHWYNNVNNVYHNQDFVVPGKYNIGSVQFPIMASTISYMQSIPLNNLNPKGCIVFVIAESSVKHLLEPIYTKGGGWFYVLDDKGEVITSSVPDEKWIDSISLDAMQPSVANTSRLNQRDMLVSFTVSSLNGWKYVAVLPSEVVLAKVVYIKRMIVNIVLLILFVGITASVIIAYQNYKPFQRLLRNVTSRLGDSGKAGRNEFDALEKVFTELFDSKRDLEAAMEKQLPVIQAAYFDRLIRGELIGPREIDSFKEKVGIDLEDKTLVIVLIQLNKYMEALTPVLSEEYEKGRVASKELLRNIAGDNAYIHNVEQYRIMLILSYEEADAECINSRVGEKLHEIDSEFRKYGINAYYGVSTPSDALFSAYKAYSEAKQSIEYMMSGAGNSENRQMWFHKIPVSDDSYYYPLEVQIRLINIIKSGQRSEMESLIKDIYAENTVKRQLSPFMYRQLMSELRGTVLKLHSHIHKSGEPQGKLLENINTLDNIAGVLGKYCDIIQQQKISYNGQLIQNIIESLNASYADPQISLASVAAQFGMNESYLSYFFKEQTGSNFSTYIENIRIEKACQLLKSKHIAVNDISALVGYNSDQSFRRSFKRARGVSPTEYKKEFLL